MWIAWNNFGIKRWKSLNFKLLSSNIKMVGKCEQDKKARSTPSIIFLRHWAAKTRVGHLGWITSPSSTSPPTVNSSSSLAPSSSSSPLKALLDERPPLMPEDDEDVSSVLMLNICKWKKAGGFKKWNEQSWYLFDYNVIDIHVILWKKRN